MSQQVLEGSASRSQEYRVFCNLTIIIFRDTSMGFSPLEGLMMGQRVGDIDVTVIPYMADRLSVSVSKYCQ